MSTPESCWQCGVPGCIGECRLDPELRGDPNGKYDSGPLVRSWKPTPAEAEEIRAYIKRLVAEARNEE